MTQAIGTSLPQGALPPEMPLAGRPALRPVPGAEAAEAAEAANAAGAATAAANGGAPPPTVAGQPADARTPAHDAAVSRLSEHLRSTPVDVRYSVDEDTRQVVVKVVDRQDGEVIRQIPSEEMLRIAKAIDTMRGVLIDRTA